MTAFIETAVRFIVEVLFNGLWEAALLALAAWAALRLMPATNATTRHSILATAFIASLILPIATTVLANAHLLRGAATANATNASQQQPARAASARSTAALSHAAALPQFSVQPPPEVRPALPRPSLALPRLLAIALVAVWLLGSCFVLARLAISLLHLEHLKHDALPLPVEYRGLLTRWKDAAKGGREVRICHSSEIVIPIAVGLFDAMILVPDRLLDELPPEDVDRVVLHELAHLRRADDWINAIERVAQAFLFFNPGILWLIGQLDLEREVACDDWVLQQNDALPYASCLAKIVETTMWPYRAMTAPGAFVTRRGMSIRIERLLTMHRDVRVRTSIGPAGLVLTAIAALCVAAAFISPSIAYTGSSALAAAKPAQGRSHASAEHANHVPRRSEAPAEPQILAQAASGVPSAAPAAASSAPKAHVAVAVHAAPATSAQPGETPATAPVRSETIAAADAKDYVDDLASAGYSNLTVDELVQLKTTGVTGDYIRRLQAAGLSHPSIKELVTLSAMGVDPEYVAEMRRRFGDSLTVDQIAALKSMEVTSGYVDDLTSAGLNDLTASQLETLKAMSVTGQYVRDLTRAGYPNLTPSQLEQLRAVRIDAEYVRRAQEHGFHDLPLEKLIELKVTGVLPR